MLINSGIWLNLCVRWKKFGCLTSLACWLKKFLKKKIDPKDLTFPWKILPFKNEPYRWRKMSLASLTLFYEASFHFFLVLINSLATRLIERISSGRKIQVKDFSIAVVLTVKVSIIHSLRSKWRSKCAACCVDCIRNYPSRHQKNGRNSSKIKASKWLLLLFCCYHCYYCYCCYYCYYCCYYFSIF